ncbi:putative fungal specific transcription factor [Lyophyllum shimeji]|uniref:Fungal specific transcription factor n=1 Tax=Lyophyllum shimeji TaxID=47721 RepID=A0A9P3PFZ5_LYOSH|nr:putative fungal specific transcription factor [Lyophyllum shimeji]
MATPPGEPSSATPSSQPLPQQPQPPTPKPTPADKPPSKKPRQRKPPQKQDSIPDTPQPYPPRGHILPYPPPPPPHYHIMNPSYGSPYNPQQHYASQPSPGASSQPVPAPPHQYAYPMHYYPPYQYPGPMMMYPQAPRPTAAPDTPQSMSSPQVSSAALGNKRKRKSTGGKADRSDDEGASGSDNRGTSQTQQQHAQNMVDLKKRTKTQRACDSCRSRKIRCDVLPDADPPVCQHCKQYGFECTFFLPITETRFKKKKLEEESTDKERSEPNKAASSPQADTNSSVFGPTSTAHLLHSQATISSRIYENYDLRYHHTFEVSNLGDGLITVRKPATEETQLTHPKPVDLRIERDVIEQLVNAYFTDVAPLLPVVTKAEFLATPNPPPILLYSMCLVAAARREVPQAIFDSIRFAVNNIIKAEDVLSTASIVNVQSLLILCMTGDCHSQFVSNALSGLWIRLGTAIRMAQDLGLHRAESGKQNIELRRRLWGACLISDRWTSLTYGHPYMIDVQDCDARLPSSGDLNDLYMDELVRLSVILGRVLKTIYSPSGLTFTTDDMLYALLADMENWKAGLPDHLKFRGPETPRTAGLLHLLYSYSCPAHLKFGLTVEQWSSLVALTAESIDWLEKNDHIYDVWLLVAYAATSCALVQYHTWARRKDEEAAAKLRKLRDTVRRWEGSISPDHMSARRKTAEIIALLYEATQGPPLPIEAPALNPTSGVTLKTQVGLEYKKDPTRPGGGVFIAHGQAAKEGDFKDLPEGVVISGTSDAGSDLANQQAQQGGVASPASPMVNFTPIGRKQGSHPNVNPAMNMQGQQQGNVQLLNVLDGPHGTNTLQEFASMDTGFLEGIPGGMFDWGQWDSFFSRFSGGGAATSNGMEQNGMASFQQQPRPTTQTPMQLSSQGEQNMPTYPS